MPRLDRVATWQGSTSQESGNKLLKQRVTGLRKLIQRRRQSVSSFRTLGGVNLGMQTHRLLDAFVDYEENGLFSECSDSSEDSDLEAYVSDPEVDEADNGPGNNEETASTSKWNEDSPGPSRLGLGGRTKSDLDRSDRSSGRSGISPSTRPPAPSSVSAGPTPTIHQPIPSIIVSGNNASPKSKSPAPRPPLSRSASSNRFSSSPIPEAKVNTDEGAGPSIMFAASASPPRFAQKLESIYARRQSAGSPTSPSAQTNQTASGFPGPASVPLSFNDLPSRAQHLILNELMVQHSSATAVLFTTLPSPVHGTSHSEQNCASYLSDLEVLWQGLPPSLLVHSNSMTVTMNL